MPQHETAIIDIDAIAERSADRDRMIVRSVSPTTIAWCDGGEDLCRSQIVIHGRQSLMSYIELGRWLVYAKSELGHGEFLGFLEEMGIAARTAQQCMAVAARIADKSFVRQLGSPKAAIALLGMSDDDLDDLDAGVAVGGVDPDGLGSLTAVELREKVRSLKAKTDKGKEQLARAREKIDALHEDIERLTTGDDGDDETEQAHAYRVVGEAIGAVRRFGAALMEIEDATERAHAWLTVSRMVSEIKDDHPQLIDVSLAMAGAAEGV